MYGEKHMNVRMLEVELGNFKSVKKGMIMFQTNPDNFEAFGFNPDILGIYGQNGSGKTALIVAVSIIKALFSGEALLDEVSEDIDVDADFMTMKLTLLLHDEELNNKYNIEYSLQINRAESPYVEFEEIAYSFVDQEGINHIKKRFSFNASEAYDGFLQPQVKMNEIIANDKEKLVELNVIKNECKMKKKSFLFDWRIIRKLEYDAHLNYILRALMVYAKFNMMIIENKDFGSINLNQLLHIQIAGKKYNDEDTSNINYVFGNWYVDLFQEGSIELKLFEPFTKVVDQINLVIHSFIPDLTLKCLWNDSVDDKGNPIKKYQFLSCRDGRSSIPLRCESDGIKKLISICNGLIAFYNEPSFFLAIDEFDSGVFEYLLGEVLDVLQTGKGQFLFTAHNLRPLEVLETKNIFLTTADAEERYIKFNSLHPTNNPRDKYLNYIFMNSYKKPLYIRTESSELSYALRKAGKIEIK